MSGHIVYRLTWSERQGKWDLFLANLKTGYRDYLVAAAMSERKFPSSHHVRASAEAVPLTVYNYKRVTAAEAAEMWGSSDYPVWNGNRPLNEERAHRIAQAIISRGDFGPLPIVIGVVASQNYIIDGQHRLCAASLLPEDISGKLFVWICSKTCGANFGTNAEEQLRAMFVATNCGTPVPLRFWLQDVKIFGKTLLRAIGRRWPGIIVPHDTHCPRITLEKFMKAFDKELCDAAQTQTLSIPVAMELLELMNNEEKQKMPKKETAAIIFARKVWKVEPGTLNTVKNIGFYLGLDRNWPDIFISRLVNVCEAAGGCADNAGVDSTGVDSTGVDESLANSEK